MIQAGTLLRFPCVLLVLALLAGAWAQPAGGAVDGDAAPPAAPPFEASLEEPIVGDDEAGEEAVPALVAVGVDGGFPAYRTVALRASLQVRYVGVAARLGWGPGSGAYVGGTLRGYPPIPGSPLPVWIGGGLGATSAGATPFAAVGAHVPVAPRWRVDVEAGVAFPELLDDRTVAPHVALGVSYAFATSLDTSEPEASAAAPRDPAERYAGARCEPTEPDPSRLRSALNDTVDDFIDDLRATYGSLYTGLSYSVRVRDRDVDGDVARLTVRYRGSVREIATGERHSTSGEAEATFRWNGCEWRRAGLSY